MSVIPVGKLAKVSVLLVITYNKSGIHTGSSVGIQSVACAQDIPTVKVS